MKKLEGGCQCGQVRFAIVGDMHFACVCHCPSCRKAAGAPIVGWAMFEVSDIVCDRSQATVFHSSAGVSRSFCANCGTTLFFEATFMPGLIDITTESFDEPDEVLPTAQIWTRYETTCARKVPSMVRFEELPPLL